MIFRQPKTTPVESAAIADLQDTGALAPSAGYPATYLLFRLSVTALVDYRPKRLVIEAAARLRTPLRRRPERLALQLLDMARMGLLYGLLLDGFKLL